MILWVDAHISPKFCPWIRSQFALDAVHVRDLGLREAEDAEIFDRAREEQVVIFTKDEDFVDRSRVIPGPRSLAATKRGWLRSGV